MNATKKDNRSEQEAKAQAESIFEMVRALDRETAAQDHVRDWTAQQCSAALLGRDTSRPEVDTDEAWRETLADVLGNERSAGNCDEDGVTVEQAAKFEFDDERARETIMDDPLSVEVRSGWHNPGENAAAEEFCILLCTGGPAVRIVGDLCRGEPSRPRIEHQDWFTPWTEYFPTDEEQAALETYCAQFYFGE